MLRPYMRVTFVDKQSLTIMNPKPWTCVEFGNCSYWHKTANLSWWNLSSNQYANFYESASCMSGGYFHYISDRKGYAGDLNRINKKKERFMRSMMLGELSTVYRAPSITYMSACPKSKEAATISTNDTTTARVLWGMENESGGLSSNWSDDLPDESKIAST